MRYSITQPGEQLHPFCSGRQGARLRLQFQIPGQVKDGLSPHQARSALQGVGRLPHSRRITGIEAFLDGRQPPRCFSLEQSGHLAQEIRLPVIQIEKLLQL